jgi:PEP-CTERM putative exosortase interaction domain
VTLTGELDTATEEYSYDSVSNSSFAQIEASIKPSLNFDFSIAGDTLLTVTWAAPAGKKIVIAPPWGETLLSIQFAGGSRKDSGLQLYGILDAVSFTDLTGSFGGVVHTSLTFASTNYFEVRTYLPLVAAGTEITFTAVNFSYLLPGSLDINFESVAATEMRIFGSITLDGEPMPDPGQWLSVQNVSGSAIPEPSTYALIFGSAALGFVVWRRRKLAGAGSV